MSDNTGYRIYGTTTETGKTRNGGELTWSHGCNRTKHVDELTELFYDARGEVVGASTVLHLERGPCPRTADSPCRNLGGFLYP